MFSQDALNKAVQIVKGFEGCKLTAYPDPASPRAQAEREGRPAEGLSGAPWTIGYGDTGPDVYEGVVWTQSQADSSLSTRLSETMARVVALCPQLSLQGAENRLAACTSLAYNVGVTAFAGSTVARMVRTGNNQAAADAFLLWNKAGGNVVQGLVNRRTAERTVFLS